LTDLWNKTALVGLALYLSLSAVAFYGFVNPSLNGWNKWRVGADSATYVRVAEQIHHSDDLIPLLGFAQNLILPALVAVLLKTTLNIAIFNISLFLFSVYIIAKTLPGFKQYIFLPFVLLAPTTFSALLTLNKEIFVLFSAVLLLRWLTNGSRGLLLFLIALSLVLRWEQAMVILLFAVVRRLNWSPKRVFWLLLFGISCLFPLIHRTIPLPPNLKVSSGVIEVMNKMQDQGLYFLLFIPKLITALASQLFRWWIPLFDKERFLDLQTGVFVIGNQFCMVALAVFVWRKGLWRLSNKVVYFVIIYIVLFCSAPLNSPRYLYMVYIVVAGFASSPSLQSKWMAIPDPKPNSLVQRFRRYLLLEASRVSPHQDSRA
jgi:hypothetical protein